MSSKRGTGSSSAASSGGGGGGGGGGGKDGGRARPASAPLADPDADEITEQFLSQLNAKKVAIERSITAVNLATKQINALTEASRLAVGDEVQRA